MEETTQTTKQHNPYLIPGAIVIAGIIIAGAVFFTKTGELKLKESQSLPAGGADLQEQSAPAQVSIELDGWPSMGDPKAAIVMVEYSDFACPFCKRFWQETLPSIKRDYIDTGKVRFVYKDFIVVGGDRAAEAAHCAAEQGKYWEYHDLLFSRQNEDRANWASAETHGGYAKELGLDEAALTECFESRRYQGKVISSTGEATQNGGQGTPYFLINNVPLFGAMPYSSFQEVIESLLSEQ